MIDIAVSLETVAVVVEFHRLLDLVLLICLFLLVLILLVDQLERREFRKEISHFI